MTLLIERRDARAAVLAWLRGHVDRTCRLVVFWFLRWLVGYLILERSGVCGLVVGVEAKRVLSDGIPILGFGSPGLAPGVRDLRST